MALIHGVECIITNLSAQGRVLRPCLTDRYFIPRLIGQHFLYFHWDLQFILAVLSHVDTRFDGAECNTNLIHLLQRHVTETPARRRDGAQRFTAIWRIAALSRLVSCILLFTDGVCGTPVF